MLTQKPVGKYIWRLVRNANKGSVPRALPRMHGGPAPDRHSVEQARRPQEREADTRYGLARQSH